MTRPNKPYMGRCLICGRDLTPVLAIPSGTGKIRRPHVCRTDCRGAETYREEKYRRRGADNP